MCRLLCWASTSAETLVDVLSEPRLNAFTDLSRIHRDGWGLAGVIQPSSTPVVERSTSPAFSDARLGEIAESAFRGCVVHFRQATPGLPVELPNTHPFLFDDIAFAHNGSIHPQERLDELLTTSWRDRMTGTTDSERYFLAVMAEIENGLDLATAIDVVVTRITRDYDASSLNAMFITSESLFVVNSHDPAKAPGPEFEPDGQPYYQLRLRQTSDTVVVASSGFPQSDDEGWETLPNHTLLTIDLAAAATTSAPLGSLEFVPAR
ncbi:MAG TPA: class II glutamine amidotransferase [Acidimicrobiales bacterium]|jgi:predicted glutamine amidotransferase|nr:class II glutamine amidotransferase [Acidimicrobiales bacterium]